MRLLRFSIFLVLFASCYSTRSVSGKKDDGKIEVNLIQVNDVYEIAPLSGGREGGIARLATLKKNYLQKNPNSFLLIAGDFLSPSVYHSLQYNGQPIRGRQMVEALNSAGMDLAVFGNHEFDIRESELQSRINESAFRWISTNSFNRKDSLLKPFKKANGIIPQTYILEISDSDGTKARIGFFGICLPFNKADYVGYTDPFQAAKTAYDQLKDSVDAVVAITHQLIKDDEQLARELPGLAVILGGHEHDQRFSRIGNIYITKAMANAKSAYVVTLQINKRKKKLTAIPKLEPIDERLAFDSATNRVVQKWTSIADSSFGRLGFNPRQVVLQQGEPLDGREEIIRIQPTNLGKMIVSAIAYAKPASQVALMNTGSIRVDDILQMPVTEYDILRTLPFGGSILEVDMKGGLLIRVLEQGAKNKGNGGYLVFNNEVENKNGNWLLKGIPIETTGIYRVALAEFLLSGKEANFEFLNLKNPDIVKAYPVGEDGPSLDIRKALIKFLRENHAANR